MNEWIHPASLSSWQKGTMGYWVKGQDVQRVLNKMKTGEIVLGWKLPRMLSFPNPTYNHCQSQFCIKLWMMMLQLAQNFGPDWRVENESYQVEWKNQTKHLKALKSICNRKSRCNYKYGGKSREGSVEVRLISSWIVKYAMWDKWLSIYSDTGFNSFHYFEQQKYLIKIVLP